MILSDYDIQQKRKEFDEKKFEVEIGRGSYPINIVGHPTQYFFAVETDEGIEGICGLNARLLSLRNREDPASEAFYADLAVETHIPGFYAEVLNELVTSITVIDSSGNKETGLCRYQDVEKVETVINSNFKPNGKPKLQLVVNNPKIEGKGN